MRQRVIMRSMNSKHQGLVISNFGLFRAAACSGGPEVTRMVIRNYQRTL